MKTGNENTPELFIGHLRLSFSVLSNLPPLLGFQLTPFKGFELFFADLFAEKVAEQLRPRVGKGRKYQITYNEICVKSLIC